MNKDLPTFIDFQGTEVEKTDEVAFILEGQFRIGTISDIVWTHSSNSWAANITLSFSKLMPKTEFDARTKSTIVTGLEEREFTHRRRVFSSTELVNKIKLDWILCQE